MSRYSTKSDSLAMSTVAAIKGYCDHNVFQFWNEHLRSAMSASTFYQLMRGEPGSSHHLRAIEEALLQCDMRGEFLDTQNEPLMALAKFFHLWWTRYSEEQTISDERHLVTRSASLDPVTSMLKSVKLLDERGFPTPLMLKSRKETPR